MPGKTLSRSLIALLAFSAIAHAGGGDTQWTQFLVQGNGGPKSTIAGDAYSWRRTMRMDASGRLLVVGSTSNAAPAGYDWRVAKVDSDNGNVLWSQTFDAGFGDDHPYALALDANGNAIVVGSVRETGGDRWRVHKLASADGALIWQQDFGGAIAGAARLVEIDVDGRIVVAGARANGSDNDIRVLRLAEDGSVIWQRDLSGDAGIDSVNALVLDPVSRDASITGVLTRGGVARLLVARLHALSGNVVWQDERTTTNESFGHDLVLDGAGNVIVVGLTNRHQPAPPDFTLWTSSWVLKYAGNGQLLWQRSYDTVRGEAATVMMLPGNDILVGGYRRTTTLTDAWMTRLAADGTPKWERAPNAPRFDRHNTLALGPDGHVLSMPWLPDFERMILRKYNVLDGGVYWGGDYVSSSNPWVPAALLAAGNSMWVYGVWADSGLLTAPARLHLRRIDNPSIGNEPSRITFVEKVVAPGSIVQSETVSVSGFAGSLSIAVNQGEYSKGCIGVFTTATSTITAGETLCLRHTAGPNAGDVRTTQVVVGTTAASFRTIAKWPTSATVGFNPIEIGFSHTYQTWSDVASTNGTPTGTVEWETDRPQGYNDDGTPRYMKLCVTATLVNGHADCSRQALQVGAFQVRAAYSGDANFQASVSAYTPFTVVPAGGQVVVFPPVPDQPIGTQFTLSTKTAAGLNARMVNLTPDTCALNATVFPRIVDALAIGVCTLRADHPGNTTYLPAPAVDQSFRIKYTQQITFAALSDRVYGDPPVLLQATGGTGAAIVFTTQTPATCTTSGAQGATLGIVGAGQCVVAADQPADDTHFAAPTVLRNFAIARAPQTIDFATPANRALGSPAFVVATSGGGSGLPVAITSLTPAVCTSTRRDGATVTVLASGACVLAAHQDGTPNYLPADLQRDFTVFANEVAINAARTGDGDGRVIGPAIDCGAQCTASMQAGQTVLLTARPEPGSLFAGWSGCDATRGNRCRLALRAARPVQANFAARIDPTRPDFDGNGHPDLLYRDGGTLRLLTLTDADTLLADTPIAAVAPSWRLRAIADVDGDGDPDLLWRDASGDVHLWTLQGATLQSQQVLLHLDSGSDIVASADFDGDDDPDLLLRDADGELRLRWMAHAVAQSQQVLATLPLHWQVLTATDVDGDLQPDLVLRDANSGRTQLWSTRYDTGASRLALDGHARPVPDIPIGWQLIQAADWDGDLQSDLLLREPVTGAVLLLKLDRGLVFDDAQPAAIDADFLLEPQP